MSSFKALMMCRVPAGSRPLRHASCVVQILDSGIDNYRQKSHVNKIIYLFQ